MAGGREAWEISEAADVWEWSMFDTCIHGNYPNETDCGCSYPDAPRVLIAKWRGSKEYSDVQ